jgi:hypothetical protein
MSESTSKCDTANCPDHFHSSDAIFVSDEPSRVAQLNAEERQNNGSESPIVETGELHEHSNGERPPSAHPSKKTPIEVRGFERIILNFTPS